MYCVFCFCALFKVFVFYTTLHLSSLDYKNNLSLVSREYEDTQGRQHEQIYSLHHAYVYELHYITYNKIPIS